MKKAVITGANKGIGLEFCRQLKDSGWEVYALCRKPSEGLKALGVQVIEDVDVRSEDSIARAKEALGDNKIDLLINNAGIFLNETWDSMDYKAIEDQFQVNTLGPLRVTHQFSPLFNKGAKVAIITSRLGSITDNSSGNYYGYRMSKVAVNMAGVCLSHDLKRQEVSLVLLHPGYVRTDMTNGSGDIGPDEAARGMIKKIEELTPSMAGSFWHSNGEALEW